MTPIMFFMAGMACGITIGILWVYSRRPKLSVPIQRLCACGHGSNYHADNGKGECTSSFGISEKFPKGSSCACEFFCLPKPPEPDKSAQELERMLGIK